MGRYTDWVLPYLHQQAAEAQKLPGHGTDDKLKRIATVASLWQAYSDRLNGQQASLQPFIITMVTGEHVVSQQVFDNAVELTVT